MRQDHRLADVDLRRILARVTGLALGELRAEQVDSDSIANGSAEAGRDLRRRGRRDRKAQ